MSYLVCHVEKYKKRQMAPIGNHNNRIGDKHSNLDIDPERKHLNFSASTGQAGNPQVDYKSKAEDIAKRCFEPGYSPRKDAVWMVGIVVTSDPSFFAGLKESEIKRFFKCAYDFLANRYGPENVLDGKVHMDETTPHMHFEFMPIKDGRLKAKYLFTMVTLRLLQTEAAVYMREQGFDIARGFEDSGMRHIPIPDLKKQTHKAMHEYEVQAGLVKMTVGQLSGLKVALAKSGDFDKFLPLLNNISVFFDGYDKMLLDVAYNIRKRGELEKRIEKLTNDNLALGKAYDDLKRRSES